MGRKLHQDTMRLPWDDWEATNEEVEQVASKFIFANCYNPQVVGSILQEKPEEGEKRQKGQCQVTET